MMIDQKGNQSLLLRLAQSVCMKKAFVFIGNGFNLPCHKAVLQSEGMRTNLVNEIGSTEFDKLMRQDERDGAWIGT